MGHVNVLAVSSTSRVTVLSVNDWQLNEDTALTQTSRLVNSEPSDNEEQNHSKLTITQQRYNSSSQELDVNLDESDAVLTN